MLPVISKIFETVIHEQLSEYFISNNLFCPQQYGFRKNSSTELAALELLDRVLDQMDKHKIPINFHIDLSKAFDSLRHDILLDSIDRMHIEQVTEFNFLGLIIDSNLNWKAHLSAIGNKISRVIGLLRKLKYIFPKQVLHSIYNSLIMPHLNYSLLAWGIKSHKIEQLQKKAIRVLYSKSPIAHTEPLFIKMNQTKLSDLYTCQLLKLYYKLYRNKLPRYFDNFLPEFGIHNHTLRNDLIRLPAIRCEFGEMNAKYQMHLRLRELDSPLHSTAYPSIEISEDTLDINPLFFNLFKD